MISLSIISADAKRLEVAEYRLAQAIEEEIYSRERPQRIEKLAERMFNELKGKIEETKDCNSVSTIIWDDEWENPIVYHPPKKKRFDWQEYRDAFSIVRELLRQANYEVEWYECTPTWHTRDGRVFSVCIKWEK